MTSKHRSPKLSTPDLDTSDSEKNEAPESNLAFNDYEPASLDLIYPNTGGLVLYDDLCMVYIPGVDQYIDLIQDPTLE